MGETAFLNIVMKKGDYLEKSTIFAS